MRRLALITCTAVAIVASCGDDSAVFDAGRDTARDVPRRDVPSDVPPDAWTSEWRHEPEVEHIDGEPCTPWEPIARMERGLPPGLDEPEVLWRFYAPEDPSYDASAASREAHLDWPTVSPDGTLWMTGPKRGQITHLDREGRMIAWFSGVRSTTSDLGPLAVAPDGTLLVARYGAIPAITGVVHFDSEGEGDTLDIILPARPALAVASDGMVYLADRTTVYATCRGERLMWRLHHRARDGEEASESTRLVVHDDVLHATFAPAQRTYVVTADGSVTPTLMAPDFNSELDRYVGGLTSTTNATYVAPEGHPEDIRTVVASQDRLVEVAGFGLLTANGDLWREADASDGYVYEHLAPPDYLVAGSIPVDDGPQQQPIWTEDGGYMSHSILRFLPDGRLPYDGDLVHFDADGVLQWRVPLSSDDFGPAIQGGFGQWALDEQGVLYLRLKARGNGFVNALLAIQTDALPPPRSSCLSPLFGCNAQRDGRVEP